MIRKTTQGKKSRLKWSGGQYLVGFFGQKRRACLASSSYSWVSCFSRNVDLVATGADSLANIADSKTGRRVLAAAAAFSTYFCMYAFRKPFTAATYSGQSLGGMDLKDVLVLSQLFGYMMSKFIGVRVVSEMPRNRRAVSIVGLIAAAELALVGFAFVPFLFKPVCLAANGHCLGMIFGLVLAYLEGQKQTEALAAGLCASFIVSSGVVRSVGSWLMQQHDVSEFDMPWQTGALFFVPLLVSVWLLDRSPEPDTEDQRLRSARNVMTREQRFDFIRAYAPGISALLFVYAALTIVRTVRDDFGVELWNEMGVADEPSIFAKSETLVAVFVMALNACMIFVVSNMKALRLTVAMMAAGFALAVVAALGQWQGVFSPFVFMVLFGIGLYIPYVAFHTTLFERLLASSKRHGNLGFLMYLADATGYLFYAAIVVVKIIAPPKAGILPVFRSTLLFTSLTCIAALVGAVWYFHRMLSEDSGTGPQPLTHAKGGADA